MTVPRDLAEVRVTVPATSANLGPGFDALGLALGLYDDVTVQLLDDDRLTIEVEGEGADQVPRDASHLVVRSMAAAYAALGMPLPGLRLRCVNRIPHGKGLGSSAAAIVAGVTAAVSLARSTTAMDGAEVLRLCAGLEGHPDNVAACLLGGLTVAWQDDTGARAVRLDPLPAVEVLLFVPSSALSTQKARGLLPATVPHADAAHAVGRAALLVEALTRRPDLLLAATEDRLHQSYRAGAMPETAALVARLRDAGVAAVVSGAGPSVLAFVTAGDATGRDAPAETGWSGMRLAIDVSGVRTTAGAG